MDQQLANATFVEETGRLQLRGNVRAGLLDVEFQETTTGNDNFMVTQGTIAGQNIYRAVFSYDSGRVLVAQLKDADVGMTVVFSDDDTGNNSYMTIIHDGQLPQTFTLDKSVAAEKRDLSAAIVGSAVEPGAKTLDLVGRRPVPDLTPGELFDTFGALPGFQQFLRGDQSEASQFSTKNGAIKPLVIARPCACFLLCLVPACGLACLLCRCVRNP